MLLTGATYSYLLGFFMCTNNSGSQLCAYMVFDSAESATGILVAGIQLSVPFWFAVDAHVWPIAKRDD